MTSVNGADAGSATVANAANMPESDVDGMVGESRVTRFAYRPPAGGEVTRRWTRRNCRGLEPEFHDPVRSTPMFMGQRSKPGLTYMCTSGGFVRHESRLEGFVLLSLDYDRRYGVVSSQPFRIWFDPATGLLSHVPDFFARRYDGVGVVVDVKPRGLLGKAGVAAQFAETARLCEQVGWRHVVMHEPDPAFGVNLRWLSGYRRQPESVDVVAPVAFDRVAGGPLPWADLVGECAAGTGLPRALVTPALGHLLWQQDLHVDLDTVFHAGKPVSSGGASHGA